MFETTIHELEDLCETWSRAMASLVWGQWRMVDTGLRNTQTILAAAAPADPTAGLLARALARAKQGLAPPREVYAAPYRDQINWAEFPAWARPSDPELYEGCTHEG